MPFAREIILFILDFIRFRVPRDSEKDSYYTVLGNTLVRVSNHCTWLHIWDDILEKNPKWKGMRIISIVFEDQNDTFNNNCLVLKRERRKPIRVEEYVYQLNGNAHYLSKDEIKAIINSIKLIERNNSFSDPTGKAIYCPRVSVNPSSTNTTTDKNGNTTYSTNYGYGADYVSESIDNKQHKTRYNMKKTIRLSESDLHNIIKECVDNILSEGGQWINDKGLGRIYVSDNEIDAMAKAFTPISGNEILDRGVKIIRGSINPERYYTEGHYNWEGNNLFADVIIEYPDGKRAILNKK